MVIKTWIKLDEYETLGVNLLRRQAGWSRLTIADIIHFLVTDLIDTEVVPMVMDDGKLYRDLTDEEKQLIDQYYSYDRAKAVGEQVLRGELSK